MFKHSASDNKMFEMKPFLTISGDLDLDAQEREQENEMKDEVDKMQSALGKEILKEELTKTKVDNLDPRSASRTPSAKKEPPISTRYVSSANAGKVVSHCKQIHVTNNGCNQQLFRSFASDYGRVRNGHSYNVQLDQRVCQC